MAKIKVIAIVGPTASGKTELSVKLAKRLNGEIISADSMQIYKNIPIATAVPTNVEKENVPHHLMEFLELGDSFSVAQYVKLATEKIKEVNKNGKLPIIVGGTGLYVDSLLLGTNFFEEDTTKIRAVLELEAEQKGIEALFERVKQMDPEYAAKLHINDKKRIIRALEMMEYHKRTVTSLNKEAISKESPFDVCFIGINYEDRQKLYDRINRRVDLMLENGLLEEAKQTFNKKLSKTSAQAIGHKELYCYFKGEVSLEEAAEKLKMETRRYAKRQLTWFKRNQNINWIMADSQENILQAALEIIEREI